MRLPVGDMKPRHHQAAGRCLRAVLRSCRWVLCSSRCGDFAARACPSGWLLEHSCLTPQGGHGPWSHQPEPHCSDRWHWACWQQGEESIGNSNSAAFLLAVLQIFKALRVWWSDETPATTYGRGRDSHCSSRDAAWECLHQAAESTVKNCCAAGYKTHMNITKVVSNNARAAVIKCLSMSAASLIRLLFCSPLNPRLHPCCWQVAWEESWRATWRTAGPWKRGTAWRARKREMRKMKTWRMSQFTPAITVSRTSIHWQTWLNTGHTTVLEVMLNSLCSSDRWLAG